MNELISVVIPTYNRASILSAAVNSVLGQTYPQREIIVVDDGSMDDTQQIIEHFKDQVKYIRTVNGGASAARNVGVRHSRGELIAFLDSDDEWRVDKLKKQAELISAGFDMVISDIEITDNERGSYTTQLRRMLPSDGQMFEQVLKFPEITCSSMLIKRNVFDALGGFDESLKTAEDIDLLLRAAYSYKLALVPEPLVRYRKSSDSLSNKVFTQNRLKVIEQFKQKNPEYSLKNPRYFNEIEANIHLSYARDLLWHRSIADSKEQIIQSMQNKFTLRAFSLLLKNTALALLIFVFPKYGKHA